MNLLTLASVGRARRFTAAVTGGASGEAALAWDAVAEATGYKLYYGTTSGGPYQAAEGSGQDLGNVTSYTKTGLTPATRYYFKITSYQADADSEVGLEFVDEVNKDIT